MGDDIAKIKETFINESSDLLDMMEASLLTLEKEPQNEEAINSLFRSAHTIKGSSGMLGFEDIEKFTHLLENVLTRVRNKELSMNNELIDLFLECKDHIANMINCCVVSESILDEDLRIKTDALKIKLNKYSSLAEEKIDRQAVEELRKSGVWHISVKFFEDIFTFGFDPLSFINYLQKLGELKYVFVNQDNLPLLELMNPEKCYLSFEIGLFTDHNKKDIEDVFEFVIDDINLKIIPPESKVEEYIQIIQDLETQSELIGEILVKAGVITRRELEEALQTQKVIKEVEGEHKKLGEIIVEEKVAQAPVVDKALDKQKKLIEQKIKETKTIKVDSDKLDSLINMVGELVIANASILQKSVLIGDKDLQESVSIMNRLIEDIRDRAMQLRMVPVGDSFSKFNRVVRDISKEFGKEIELEIIGGETELDRTVIEKINDPLMHLIRNCCDHGIELPEERERKGKPRKGKVVLKAYNDAGSIVIEVIDDGKGINKNKILEKAKNMGIININQNLSDKEILNLIFHPGLSTAENVTKFSGRGVGMDVVKKGIESLRGSIDIESKEDVGTRVIIRLPLTLAIIDGFMVTVGETYFIIPLDMVLECVEFNSKLKEESDNKRYINLRGEILPYIRLRDIFRIYDGEMHSNIEFVVIVKHGGEKIGLVVDKLNGEVQTVIKNLGQLYKNTRHISGATILGDGSVALILDIQNLISEEIVIC
jgi:two-component system chemotaxis sensor kinase CheA